MLRLRFVYKNMNLLNRVKPIHLLILLIFIIIPLIVLLLSFSRKSEREEIIVPTPTPSITGPVPTLTLPPGVKTMEIIRSAPFPREDIFYLPIQPVELTFTDAVSPESLRYNVEPSIETKVEQGSIPNALIISPLKWWEDGTTKITVLSTTTSNSGAVLASPFTYDLRVSLPPAPNPELDDNY